MGLVSYIKSDQFSSELTADVHRLVRGGEHHVDKQTQKHADAGINDAGDRVGNKPLIGDGVHNDEVDDCARLDSAAHAEHQVDVNHAEQAKDYPDIPEQGDRGVVIEPIDRDHHQAAQKRAHETVAAAFDAVLEHVAKSEDSADTGKTGISSAKQIFIRHNDDEDR